MTTHRLRKRFLHRARHCVMASTAIEVTINGNYLNLQAGEVSLRYRLQDWDDQSMNPGKKISK